MVKKIIFGLFVCLLSIVGHKSLAVPAAPWPVEKIQPDGKKISVYVRGDEKARWMESLDGYSLMYDAKKYIVYAELDADKNMVPSKSKYTALSMPPSGIQKGISYSQSQIKAFEQIWKATKDTTPQKAEAVTGTRNVPCILMGFKDKAFSKSDAEFETLFNQIGLYPSDESKKGSVRDFFRENSYGKFDLMVTIAGPYTADNDMIYYADQPEDVGYRWFAEEAARKAYADGFDFTPFAVDGRLESFHVLFAGYGDEYIGDGEQIWSHNWQLVSPIYLGGVRISTYTCSAELRGSSGEDMTHIGVICHEMNHVYGSPDYYDTTENGPYLGTGYWDLMAYGTWTDNGRQPAHINVFQKILYGWITPVELISYTEITAMPSSALNPVAYSIKANDNGELYVLENRQKVGFDSSLPGHGLLIWHIHPDALHKGGNNDGHPQQVYPVVAFSTYAIPSANSATYGYISSPGTPFPGMAGKTEFTAKTIPTMFTWSNLQPVLKPLTEITEAPDNTISFKFMDGPVVPITNLQTEVLDGDVKLSWTAADHPKVLGYKVYRDGTLLYTINNQATTTYSHIGVINGTYKYSVSAFYELTESDKVTANVIVDSGLDTYSFPITNLNGVAGYNKAYLSWTRPFDGGWATIAGAAYETYTFEKTTSFFAGTLWGPEHLRGYDGYEATQIRFYLNETTTGVAYKVQIWEMDNWDAPLREQAYTGALTSGIKNVTLSSPLTIDASKSYLIGVEIHTVGGDCLVVDAMPTVAGRNWIYIDDKWSPLDYREIEGNFYTAVYLTSGNPVSPSPSIMLDSQTQKLGERMRVAPPLTKYVIYRDGVAVGQSTVNSFEDIDLEGGTTYSYCVSAVYGNGNISESVCTELTTLKPVNHYKPVENVKAILKENKVSLSWNAPYKGGLIGYSGGKINTAYSMSVDTYMAARFTPEDLKKMLGMQLTKISFATYTTLEANFIPSKVKLTLCVWVGGNINGPRELIHTQAVSNFGLEWNTVDLTTPIDIDVYEELWIGIRTEKLTTESTFPGTVDFGPAVAGKGDMYCMNGIWSSWKESAGIDTNWTILGHVGSKTGSAAPALLSHIQKVEVQIFDVPEEYIVSRNGENIATLAANVFTYNDILSLTDDYTYCITAKYAGNHESDSKCVDVSFVSECDIQPENITATYSNSAVSIDWNYTPAVAEEILFSENFENGIPATWKNVDADGDGVKWKIEIGPGATGMKFVVSESYVNFYGPLTPDNWLITPAIAISKGNRLNYYIVTGDIDYPIEHYGIFISTTDANITSFDPVPLFEETLRASNKWQKRTIDLSAFEGETVYIAFRHYDSTDQFRVLLDDVSVTKDPEPLFNVYENDILIAQVTGNHYKRTLVENGTYNYCVRFAGSYCESEAVCAEIQTDNVAVNLVDISKLKAYPNPVKTGQELYVENVTPDAIIRIFSISGMLMQQQQATDLVTKVNITLPAGFYILDVGGKKIKIEVRL